MAVLGVRFTKSRREKLAQVLWILNWVSVLTGMVLINLGVYLHQEMRKRREVLAGEGAAWVPNMLVTVGDIACGVNLLGGKICHDCWDNKFPRWRLLMLPYIICTFFTFCILVVGGLMRYGMRSRMEKSLYLGLQRAMMFYKDTDTPGRCYLKKTVDELHFDRLKSNVDGKYLMDGIPFSCCNFNSPRPCIQFQLANNSAHYNYNHLTEELNHWTTGCRQALLDHYTQIMQSIGLSVLIIWFFEVSVLIGVRYLQTALENVQFQGDPDSESEGWLLQNDFAEKAQTNFNIIKNLRKVDQISTVSQAEDPNMDINIAGYGPDNIPPKVIPIAS